MSYITGNFLHHKQPQRPIKFCGELPSSDGETPVAEKFAGGILLDKTYKSSKTDVQIPEGAYKINIRPHEDGYTHNGVSSSFSIDDVIYRLGDENNSEYELDKENCVQDLVPSKIIKNVVGVYMVRLVYPSNSPVTEQQLAQLFT
ncbi:MAG: hypothetical protein AAGJ18_31230 [Bacteroidota bacterium]